MAFKFATDLIGTLAPKTIENVLETIFAILQYADTCKMRTCKVTFRDLTLGGANPAPVPFFTSAQTTAIIQAAPEPYKTLFAVASGTGLRAGELLALNVSDMDFNKKTVSISKSADDNTRLIRKPKTKKFVGTVPMPSALEAVLQNYLANHWTPNAQGLLFPP